MGAAGSPPGCDTAGRASAQRSAAGAGLTGAPLRARDFAHRPPPAGSHSYRTEGFAARLTEPMRRAKRQRTPQEDSRRRDSLLARRVPLGCALFASASEPLAFNRAPRASRLAGIFFPAQSGEQVALRIPFHVSIQRRWVQVIGEQDRAGFGVHPVESQPA